MKLSFPSKTFLVGEYLALYGGPALVLTTAPTFDITIDKTSEPMRLNGIHGDSPAGKFINKQSGRFSNQTITFTDPHQGAGGFGASSAQFAAVYQWLLQSDPLADPDSIRQLLASYHECAWQGQGLPPSGADLIAQFAGDICFFDRETFTVHTLTWPWTTIEYRLIRTGHKIATHEHIQQLNAFAHGRLYELVERATQSLEQAQATTFVNAISHYHSALQDLGFVADHTLTLVEQICSVPGVLTAKGCGALGADVILAIVESEQIQSLENWLETKNLTSIPPSS